MRRACLPSMQSRCMYAKTAAAFIRYTHAGPWPAFPQQRLLEEVLRSSPWLASVPVFQSWSLTLVVKQDCCAAQAQLQRG